VIATDTQENTVYALARVGGVGPIEDFALRMARNFVDKYDQVTGSRQAVEEYFWERIVTADGTPHDHSFVKGTPEVRTTVVTKDGSAETVISGFENLMVLKNTGSEFWGFPEVEYTSLVETTDRIMAPLPRRPVRMEPRQPQRGLVRGRPALRARRGLDPPRRPAARARGVARREGLHLTSTDPF
jgi:hypothetical protein